MSIILRPPPRTDDPKELNQWAFELYRMLATSGAIPINNVDLSGLTTANVPDSTNKRYVTDAQKVTIGNTSGINTGDETNATIITKIGYAPVPPSRTVNTHNLSADVVVTKDDVGLSNVPNVDATTTANITDSTNKRFVTDANLVVIGNTSNTNTGDETKSTILTKVDGDFAAQTGAATVSASGTNQNVTLTPSGSGYSLLNGNVGINETTPTEKLVVDGSVLIKSGNYLKLRNTANDNSGFIQNIGASGSSSISIHSDRMVVAQNDNVGIGTTSPNYRLHIMKDGGYASAGMECYRSGSTPHCTWYANIARGSLASPAVVQVGDSPIEFLGFAYDGSNFVNSVNILTGIEGTPGTNRVPSYIAFQTHPDSTASIAERMRIDSSGNVGINTTSPTKSLDINSDTIRLRTSRTITNSTDTGTVGEICWDANYIYICQNTNSWVRASLSSW